MLPLDAIFAVLVCAALFAGAVYCLSVILDNLHK
jgi:hypothetical protein